MHAARIGLVATAEGVGVLVGAAVSSYLVARVPTGRLLVAGQALMALAVLPVVLVPGYGVMLACAACSALAVPAVNAGLGGYVFAQVPSHLQGRVGAATSLLVGLPVAAAPVVAGVLLQAGGVPVAVGAATAVMGLGCWPPR